MKKLMLLLLAFILLGFVVAGCSGGNGNNDVPDSQNDDQEQQQGNDQQAEEKADNQVVDDMSEEIEISMMVRRGKGWPDDHPTLAFLEDKFNIDLNIEYVRGGSAYHEKLNVLAASNSLPDIYWIFVQEYNKWRDKGVFLDLAPYVGDYPNLKAAFSEESWTVLNPEGKIFGIPTGSKLNKPLGTMIIRKDWLDTLGLEVPETLDELLEVSKAFAADDPDGNGSNDTMGFSAAATNGQIPFMNNGGFFMGGFGLHNDWGLVDGKIEGWVQQTDKIKEVAGWLNEAYVTGALDQEFAVNKPSDVKKKFLSGKTGMVINNMFNMDRFEKDIKEITPDAELMAISYPEGPHGFGGPKGPNIQKVVMNAEMDENKRKRILTMLDWWMTEEGQFPMEHGIEGVHYTKEGDSYKPLPAYAKQKPGLLTSALMQAEDFDLFFKVWDDEQYIQKMNELIDINTQPKYAWDNAALGLHSETLEAEGANLGSKFLQAFVKVVVGDEPASTLDAASEEWFNNGGEQIVEELTKAYDLYGTGK